jgi:hypothetical protein
LSPNSTDRFDRLVIPTERVGFPRSFDVWHLDLPTQAKTELIGCFHPEKKVNHHATLVGSGSEENECFPFLFQLGEDGLHLTDIFGMVSSRSKMSV